MKIALIGYGKMGHVIEEIAISRGHEIVCIIDADNTADFDSEAFASAEVAIEFSTPSTAFSNCVAALERGVKVVCGTTAWVSRLPEIKQLTEKLGGTFFWSSNYSIGVNIFFALNRYLATMMAGFSQYTPEMTEIHHIHKLDHPSGTAISLAEGIIESDPAVTGWTEDNPSADNLLTINHQREGEVPGTHIIKWDSPVDTIKIEHCAKSRRGFALGAVVAAEWIASRSGFLSMDNLMHSFISNTALLDILKPAK
ncbi:MAG: 4-hydroxy-tetrahydrodipicolinate reductase [Muribaculaceae bacterium]|nr:4-hydroxy-tetrahydrodipicolinate reductase [Muribaculaceae bacterium]